MALTIQNQPEDFSLSGNPVEFSISSNTVVQGNHKIHVEILENVFIGGLGYQKIGEEALPVINNSVSFDVSDYLKKELATNFDIFTLFDKRINTLGISPVYVFNFYETFNNDGIKYNQISSSTKRAVNGGFSSIFLKNYQAENKKFYPDFILNEKRFLSWAPDKKLTKFQHDLTFFLAPISGSFTIRVKYLLYFSDSTTQIVYSDSKPTNQGRIHYFSPSYLTQEFDGLETISKKIVKYQVTVEETDATPFSETRTYYIDRNHYNQGRQFIFRNSLGGHDIMHLKGISENTNKIQRTVGYFQTQNDISFSEFTETFEAASGFLVNSYKSVKDAQRYVTELFRSNEIYEIVGKEIIPVIPATKKIEISRDNEFLYSFAFDYEYAYSDKYFAPLDTEQYLNPRIFYSDGIITPEPATPGQIATVDFDVMINEDRDISFELNWGADVGTTSIPATSLSGGVTASLQSQITIPGNVQGARTLIITDSLGGRYYVDYQVGDLNALFNTGEPALFNDGEQAQFNGL